MSPIKTPIYQTQEIREIECLAQERFGVAGDILMQRAGKAALDFLMRRWPQAKKIAIFCGAGNNGGDGYVMAHLAKEQGMNVTIWQVGQHDHLPVSAKAAFLACEKAGITIHSSQEKIELHHIDVIVDAICGIGLHTPLREEVLVVIDKIHRAHLPILAIDIPTGVNADSGCILGNAIHASATITFIGYKLGLLTGSGMACVGELVCSDLHLPSEIFASIKPVAEKIQLASYTSYLKPRMRDWHKGLSGHVLVIGGERGYFGAVRMAAEAALRVGAGLVTVATHPENAALISAVRPEIMCRGISHANELIPLLEKVSVIVLGPGLSQTDWAKTIWSFVMETPLPLVVDADGLNLLAQAEKFNDNWVLTPHPGEAARLLHTTSLAIQQNRLEALKQMASRYGGVIVLKGAGSLVLAPHALPALCDKGNPGMSSAGMGDILSGVIGGLIAQKIPLGDAAKLGVLLHAMAGDLAAKEGERGTLATDLLPYLRRLVNSSSST